MSTSLTVIIPCYNEAGRLGQFFSLIEGELKRNWEWLFVDDGSIDTTAGKINDFRKIAPDNINLIRLPQNKGKGAAVREGFLNASGDLAGYIDADLAASPLEFARFLDDPDIISGKSILLGIRVKTQDGKVQRYAYRHLMGRIYQTYVSNATGLTVYDTQCGFKMLARDQAVKIAQKMACPGFAFDAELLVIAGKIGMHINEQLIPWQEKGDSKVRPRHIFEMVIDIWKIRRRMKTGFYTN